MWSILDHQVYIKRQYGRHIQSKPLNLIVLFQMWNNNVCNAIQLSFSQKRGDGRATIKDLEIDPMPLDNVEPSVIYALV